MKNILYIISLCIALSCQQSPDAEESMQQAGNDTVETSTSISLDAEQMELAGVKVGKLEKDVVSAAVTCQGSITAPPEKLVSINAPMGGFVDYVKYLPGDYVKKGTLLIKLKHPDYIKLQQDYLDVRSQLEYAAQDYERQQTLSGREAASRKKLQESTALYKSLQARFMGLQQQLTWLQIDTTRLLTQGIQPGISLYAPISGYITESNVNMGQYVNSQELLCEILDKSHLHLDLDVYEKDVDKVKAGQKVQFYLNENPDNMYEGIVRLTGQKMNPETKTFDIHVEMISPPEFIKLGMYARAHIFSSADSVATLPEEAVIEQNGHQYIFVKDKEGSRMKQVNIGAKWKDKVEIKNPDTLQEETLVIAGAYYLKAALEE